MQQIALCTLLAGVLNLTAAQHAAPWEPTQMEPTLLLTRQLVTSAQRAAQRLKLGPSLQRSAAYVQQDMAGDLCSTAGPARMAHTTHLVAGCWIARAAWCVQ
jgi:hypothetical protein